MSFDKLGRLKMIVKKPPGELLILFLAVLAVPVFVLGSKYAQISEFLPTKNIEVDTASTVIGEDIYLPPPDILDKLSEKDDELAKIPLSMGSKEIVYYENRYIVLPNKTRAECEKVSNLWDDKNSVCKAVSQKRSTDREITFGLKLLNTETGEVEVISVRTKIAIDGVSIVAPDGYQIEIVERPNGIRWNWWNTLYRVVSPENVVVIKNNYPQEVNETVSRVVNGKVRKETKKVVKGFLYVPHSNYFELEENKKVLVKAGTNYDKNIVVKSFDTLMERGVKSRAFPDQFVADVDVLFPRFFERLVLLEQGDLTEFQLDPQKTVERVLIILGANGENAWRYTCNSSGACGWIQFTDIFVRGRPGTYTTIRKTYPAAKLNPNFRDGAGDHLNSMMAAILLVDYNLGDLLRRYGPKILEDPNILQKAYAGAYNGSPRHVWRALDADLGKATINWTKYLRKETHGFLFKWDYLVENDLP